MATPKIGTKCPECGARRLQNWRYPHSDACKIKAADKRAAGADQVWFASGSRKVERPSTWAEIALVEAAGLELPDEPQTIVRQYQRVERVIGGHGPEW